MKEILNEELFRIQEIMGIKKIGINEDFQTEQNHLISESLIPLLRGAAVAGKFDGAGISAVNNVVRTQTDALSKIKGSKIPSGGYNSLDEFTEALTKNVFSPKVAEEIAETIMKKIIVTPEGSKVVAKAWFEANTAKRIQQTVRQIEKGANIPPELTIKGYRDYEETLSKIATGNADIDTALKNGLEETYGKRLKIAKTEAEKAVAEAKKLDADYGILRDEVILKIKNDPDLSTKKVGNWFKLYDDKAKNFLKEKGDYDARKYLLDNLQKPSIMSRVRKLYGSGSGVSNFLGKLFSGRGIIWTVAGGLITLGLTSFYYLLQNPEESFDSIGEDDKYLKIKKVYPVTEDASKELLNYFISAVPAEVDNLLLSKAGYSLRYKLSEGTPIGDIEELTIGTPSNTYVYTMNRETKVIDEEVTPKGGSDSGQNNLNQGETFETWLFKPTTNGGGGGYGDGDYSDKTTNENGSITVTIGGTKYTAKKDENGKWVWL